jgi:non-ribosomal peptide synthetase-like protein
VIETGSVAIGANAFVGEHTVLDIGTSVGDGSQLGHTSTLYEGQRVPDGERWHGSPAQPSTVDYRRVEPMAYGRRRVAAHTAMQLVTLVFVTTPALLGVPALLVSWTGVRWLTNGGPALLDTDRFYLDALVTSLVAFLGPLLLGAVVVLSVPRVLRRFVVPGRVYPLYGVHDALQRLIRRLSNVMIYLELFGDSSYVVGYLRALGYRMPDVEQTGSNFGADQRHETPFAVEIGRGTMVSDEVSLINAEYSSTSFRVVPLEIGTENFFGTRVAFPAGGRTGRDCMIASKAMVPLDGPVRENVGLLGSPCFEIPRSVTQDAQFDHLRQGEEFRRRLGAKNRHNLMTMAAFLGVRWLHVLLLTLLLMCAGALYKSIGAAPALFAASLTAVIFTLAYFVAVERGFLRFRPLQARYCSIYEPYFWWHERYWKLLAPSLEMFNGTPLKGLTWRLVGVRVGKRLFDDGCGIPERSLVTIGDDCTLGAGSVIQCHSMEDGIFKSDHTVVGNRSTVGTDALVHYGVRIGEGASLLPDSFVMKGETVPAGATWGGNPASAVS